MVIVHNGIRQTGTSASLEQISEARAELLNVFDLIQLVGYEIVIWIRRMLDKQVRSPVRRHGVFLEDEGIEETPIRWVFGDVALEKATDIRELFLDTGYEYALHIHPLCGDEWRMRQSHFSFRVFRVFRGQRMQALAEMVFHDEDGDDGGDRLRAVHAK